MNILRKSTDDIRTFKLPFATSHEPRVTIDRSEPSPSVIYLPITEVASAPDQNVTSLREGMARHAAWLEDALCELNSTPQEAEQEGYPAPTPDMVADAEQMLRNLAHIHGAPEPAVYPTDDGEIAIMFAWPERRAALLILVDANGGVASFSTIGQESKRSRFRSIGSLSDDGIESDLRKLIK